MTKAQRDKLERLIRCPQWGVQLETAGILDYFRQEDLAGIVHEYDRLAWGISRKSAAWDRVMLALRSPGVDMGSEVAAIAQEFVAATKEGDGR
jgi:hypothetical protein